MAISKRMYKCDYVEIWENIPGSDVGLEMHLVQCIVPPQKKTKSAFVGSHWPAGGLYVFQVKRINKVIRATDSDARKEYQVKTKKEPRHVY